MGLDIRVWIWIIQHRIYSNEYEYKNVLEGGKSVGTKSEYPRNSQGTVDETLYKTV